VTFTDPEVARVGLTEARAATRGGRVACLPMADMDRVIATNATDGFIKLLAGPRPLLRNLGGGGSWAPPSSPQPLWRRRACTRTYPAMCADLHGEQPRPTVPNICGVIGVASPRPLPAARSRRPGRDEAPA